MESASGERDDRQAPEEPGDGRHPHERAASDLSGRAAESVGRRYDATKESAHEGHSPAGGDEDDQEGADG